MNTVYISKSLLTLFQFIYHINCFVPDSHISCRTIAKCQCRKIMSSGMSLNLAFLSVPSIWAFRAPGVQPRRLPEMIQHTVIIHRKQILMHPFLCLVKCIPRKYPDLCLCVLINFCIFIRSSLHGNFYRICICIMMWILLFQDRHCIYFAGNRFSICKSTCQKHFPVSHAI